LKKFNNQQSDSLLKKLEYKFKGIVEGFLYNKQYPVLVSEPTKVFNLTTDSRILLLRHDRIGDVLVSVPYIKLLKKNFPDTKIDILLSDKNLSSKRAVEPYVSEIFVYKKQFSKLFSLIRILRNRKYDLVIDLFDNPSTTSSMLIKFIKAKYNLGFEKSNSLSYTHIVPLPDKNKFHIVERISNLCLPFGFRAKKEELDLEFRISQEELKIALSKIKSGKKDNVIGINLSGSSRAKYWGTRNYIELITKINSSFPDLDVVIFSIPDYKIELDEILSKTKSISAPISDSFLKFSSYIAVCDYIITPDTSVVHLASAFKIPSVSLHTWTGSDDTGMPWSGFNSKNICLKTDSGVLSKITVETVFAAFREII
jgi:ADP-heptose:LPS heptosyltransferase